MESDGVHLFWFGLSNKGCIKVLYQMYERAGAVRIGHVGSAQTFD